MNTPHEEPRVCRACGRPLYGRGGKLSCNNKCKSAYHNKKDRIPGSYKAVVTKALRKNHRILQPLLVPFVTKTVKSVPTIYFTLQEYDFSIFTGICQNPKKGSNTIYWVYSLGLQKTIEGSGYRLIVRGTDGAPML